MELTEFDRVVMKKDKAYGGVGSLLTGTPGCGKTNAMARMALIDMQSDLRVMWRAKTTCQWSVFIGTGARLVFWMKMGLNYKVFNRMTGKEENLCEYGKIMRWKDPAEVIAGIQPRVINVVQTIPCNEEREVQHMMFVDDWVSLMKESMRKRYLDPISIYFDELEDLTPESKPGFYKKSLAVAGKQKELRKNDVHFTGATHRATEIFWVMKNKLPWNIYMHGAIPKKSSPIFQKSIDKLEQGYAFIEDRKFQKVYFKFVGEPKDIFLDITLADYLERDIERKEAEHWDRERETLEAFAGRMMKGGFSDKEIARKADVSRERIVQVLGERKNPG